MVGIGGGIKVGRAVKINITLPEEELGEIDAVARSDGETRSGLIQRALKLFLEQREAEKDRERQQMAKREAALDIRRLREKSADWDGVAEIRKWRDSR